MRITNESDYALRIVYALAAGGGVQSAGDIAETTDVTLRFALKILRKLTLAGIVASKKGSAGGYTLVKSPETLTVGELVETIEGPVHLSNCTAPDYDCPRATDCESPCGYHEYFCELSRRLRAELYSVSVADALRRSQSAKSK